MLHLNSLRSLFAGAGCAAVVLFSALPAVASDRDHTRAERQATAAPRSEVRSYEPARTYQAPRSEAAPRAYAAPHAYAAPRAYEVRPAYEAPRAFAPAREASPRRTDSAPRRYEPARADVMTVPRSFAQPRPQMREARSPRTDAAPRVYEVPRRYQAVRPQIREVRSPRVYAAPRVYEAPRTYQAVRRQIREARSPRVYAAPRREVREVRAFRAQPHFVQRTEVVRARTAPFVQYVRVARRRVQLRSIVASPLMRAVYAPRRRTEVVLYHPAYLTGRVVEIRRNQLVLQPLTGPRIIVNRYIPYYRRYRVNQFATVPAVYNGAGSYAYACSPQYYPQVAQYYSNYYGTQVAYVNGCYVPQNAQTAYYYDGYTQPYGYGYSQPYPYASGYGTPYDNCIWSSDDDNDGDGYCAGNGDFGYNAYPSSYGGYSDPYGYSSYSYPYGNAYPSSYGSYPDPYGNTGYPDPYGYNGYPDPYGYNGYPNPYGNTGYPDPYGYGGYGGYAMQQVQGLVVAKTGTTLMVLGGNGLKPVFVNAAPALRSGYAVNGPVAVGQVINAFGFYSGDMFIATALM